MAGRLERDPDNKMIGGVCSGLAKYLQIDVTLVRVLFLGALLFGGFGFLGYLVLLVIMPLPGRPAAAGVDASNVVKEMSDAATAAGEQMRAAFVSDGSPETERRRVGAGWILVALGAFFLVSNLGLLRLEGRVIWPALVILVGVWLLVRRTQR